MSKQKKKRSWEFEGYLIKRGENYVPQYAYNNIIITVDGDTLIVDFIASEMFKRSGARNRRAVLKHFKNKTIQEVVETFPGDPGKLFREGLRQVYKDLGLRM